MISTFLKSLLITLMISLPITATSIQNINYSSAGNFKGLLNIPSQIIDNSSTENIKESKLPLIIFSYDQYVDLLGQEGAAKIGYDLNAFIAEFELWGYACLIPIERHRKLNALKGALYYAQGIKEIDQNNIFLVGAGEGALLSLLAVRNTPKVKGIVIIDPENIHRKGYLSYPNLLRQMDTIKAPILFVAGKSNKRWRNKRSDLLHELFLNHDKDVTYTEYYFKKKWFWNPKFQFMKDVKEFVDYVRISPHEEITSKNTY
jgi:hypothetical protein